MTCESILCFTIHSKNLDDSPFKVLARHNFTKFKYRSKVHNFFIFFYIFFNLQPARRGQTPTSATMPTHPPVPSAPPCRAQLISWASSPAGTLTPAPNSTVLPVLRPAPPPSHGLVRLLQAGRLIGCCCARARPGGGSTTNRTGCLGKMGFFGKGGPLVKMEDFVDFGNLLGTFGAKWRQNPLFSLY